jgi:TolA-binding protein
MKKKTHKSLATTGQSRLIACCFIASLALAGATPAENQPGSTLSPDESPRQAPQYTAPDADQALSNRVSLTPPPRATEDTPAQRSDALAQRLWHNRILAPDRNEDTDNQRDLKNLIQKVRSVRFADPERRPTFSVPPEPTPEVNLTTPQTGANAEPGPAPDAALNTPTTVENLAALSPETQKELEAILEDPNQVQEPFEMAELLFLSGRTTQATVFYQIALDRTANDASVTSEDRAWILFQLANCLRETNMAKAKDAYLKLVTQYPDSPWTELAKAHGRLITWYQTARPQQWVASQQSP